MSKVIFAFGLLIVCANLGCSEKPEPVTKATPQDEVSGMTSLPSRTPLRSIAIGRYTGLEKRAVTLKPGTLVTMRNLTQGLKKNSLLTIVRNRSGEIPRKELLLYVVNAISNFGDDSPLYQYFGRGPLLPGETRILKAHNKVPASISLIESDRGATSLWWRNTKPIQGKLPLVLTLLPHHKLRVTRTFAGIASM